MKITDYAKMCRPHQYYKNLVVFLALFFSGKLFNIDLAIISTTGFIALCLVSSSGYIINDIIDCKKDKIHPEKKNRPIASGRVSIAEALLISAATLAAGLYTANSINTEFLIASCSLFLLTLSYTLVFKDEALLDLIMIAVNFVIRAVSGAFAIKVNTSAWLITGVFFIVLFLSVSKRTADLALLKENAKKHKKVLAEYSVKMLDSFSTITAAASIVVYAVYSAIGSNKLFIITVPFAFYCILRFLQIIDAKPTIPLKPEIIMSDRRLIAGTVLWAAIVFAIIYVY